MPYVDLNTIHNPATGTVPPAAWGDQIRDNDEFLIDSPACSVFNSSAVSLANGSLTVMAANSETFDNDAMHSTVTNNSRITAQTAGRYLFTYRVRFVVNGTGSRSLEYRVNGGTWVPTFACAPSPAGTSDTLLSASFMVILAATDYVEAGAFQNSGGALNATLHEFSTVFITR